MQLVSRLCLECPQQFTMAPFKNKFLLLLLNLNQFVKFTLVIIVVARVETTKKHANHLHYAIVMLMNCCALQIELTRMTLLFF